MKKAIATFLSTALALCLFGYSALRSLDFIQQTLPANQAILSYFAIMATEGGLCLWLLFYLYGAAGAWQRGLSLLMIIVDLAGSVVLFGSDTLLRSGELGLTQALAPEEIRLVVLAMSGIIAANVAASVMAHLTDPENRKAQAAEEANDAIEEAALKQITQNAQSLAAQLAPRLAGDWMTQTEARYTARLGSGETLAPSSTRKKPVENTGTQPGGFDPARLAELYELLKAQQPAGKNNGSDARSYQSETETPGFLASKQEGQQ